MKRLVIVGFCLIACGSSVATQQGGDAGSPVDSATSADTPSSTDVTPTIDTGARDDVTPPFDSAPAVDVAITVDAGFPDAGAPATDVPSPPDADPPAPDVGSSTDTFPMIYAAIIEPRCTSCHVEGRNRLVMPDAPTAWRNLVNEPALTGWIRYCGPGSQERTRYRVRPRDLELSMLSFLPDCYVRDAQHDTMTPAELTRVRNWITAGAVY